MIFRNFMTPMQEDVPKLALAFPDIPYAEVESGRSQAGAAFEGAWRCRGTAKGTSAFCVSQPRQSRICLRQPRDKHQKVAVTWDLKTSPSSLFPFSSSSSLSPTTRLFPCCGFNTHASLSRAQPIYRSRCLPIPEAVYLSTFTFVMQLKETPYWPIQTCTCKVSHIL